MCWSKFVWMECEHDVSFGFGWLLVSSEEARLDEMTIDPLVYGRCANTPHWFGLTRFICKCPEHLLFIQFVSWDFNLSVHNIICLNTLSHLSFAAWTAISISLASSFWADVPTSRRVGWPIWNACLFVAVLREKSFFDRWTAQSIVCREILAPLCAAAVVTHFRLALDDWLLRRQRDKDDDAERRVFMVVCCGFFEIWDFWVEDLATSNCRNTTPLWA